MHCAGTAQSGSAAKLGASHLQSVAQYPEQRSFRGNRHFAIGAVNVKRDVGHVKYGCHPTEQLHRNAMRRSDPGLFRCQLFGNRFANSLPNLLFKRGESRGLIQPRAQLVIAKIIGPGVRIRITDGIH